jgi:hypothetical protein
VETALSCVVTRPAAGSWRPCTTGSSRPTRRSTTSSRGAGGSRRRPTCTSSGRRTTRSCGRCTGTRPARATPPSRTSTCTPSAPTGTSSRRDRHSSRRCSGASRWGGAAESPVAHRAGRVRGHSSAVPIVVGRSAIATSGSMTSALPAQDRTRAVSRGSTPLPITRPPLTAQRRGKGGPKAHPGGTRKRPSGGRRSRRDSRGDGAGAASRAASDAAATASRQSARSPQIVRKTAGNGQHRPTTANGESAAQDGFSVAAHSAKPPLGRFCKAGVRGSIPLVSTPRPGELRVCAGVRGGRPVPRSLAG